MTNTGQLVFGQYSGCCSFALSTITPSGTYNDGNWHQAVGTYDGNGNLALYVDGNAFTKSQQAGPENFSGWWKIGYGSLINAPWPNIPSSLYFQGSLGEVAVWNTTALSASQVSTLYSAAGGGSYDSTLLGDSPTSYWKLNETAGTTFADATVGGNTATVQAQALNGLYLGTETLGVAGANSDDTAVTLDGSSGFISTQTPITDPGPLSLEIWFKTTTTTGGTLIGFCNQQIAACSYYDRLLYMTNAGNLVFGTADTALHTVESASAYNDGNWHQAVATWANNTLSLYVDKVLAGSTSGGVYNYAGYWRIGDNTLSGWLSAPSSFFFRGTVDEVAIYTYALSATQVSNHFNAR